MSADSAGAYVIRFSGTHADIQWYASVNRSASLDFPYRIGAACVCRGKVVLFCDDTANNQLIAQVYDISSDTLSNFGIYGAKLYGSTDFCCDDNAVYLENNNDSHELRAFSYSGSLQNTYRFDAEISSVFSGYRSGIYAVSDGTLYALSGGSFSALAGATVETPLSPASDQVFVSSYGKAYVVNSGRIVKTFAVDTDHRSASACVIGDRFYYPYGTSIYGYDLNSGEKVSSYRLSFAPQLLYADGNMITAVSETSSVSVSESLFVELNPPKDESEDNANTADKNSSVQDDTVSEITSGVYRVDHERYQISRIEPGTTVAEFKRNINYNGYSVAIYRDGALKQSGSVGTAMTAVFTHGNSSITFELSVIGDLTGEGNRNSRDLNLLMDYLIGAADFNGVYYLAADMSDDGTVDVVDLAILKSRI